MCVTSHEKRGGAATTDRCEAPVLRVPIVQGRLTVRDYKAMFAIAAAETNIAPSSIERADPDAIRTRSSMYLDGPPIDDLVIDRRFPCSDSSTSVEAEEETLYVEEETNIAPVIDDGELLRMLTSSVPFSDTTVDDPIDPLDSGFDGRCTSSENVGEVDVVSAEIDVASYFAPVAPVAPMALVPPFAVSTTPDEEIVFEESDPSCLMEVSMLESCIQHDVVGDTPQTLFEISPMTRFLRHADLAVSVLCFSASIGLLIAALT